MCKLTVFNHVSLDGYFTDARGDMSFAHQGNDDPEWNAFVEGNAGGGGVLVFGRVTYDLMAGFWPTPMAAERMPAIAARMNGLRKVVFSRSMATAAWNNTTLLRDPVGDIRRLKNETGPDMVILGSGSIVSQLAQHQLVDEFQVIINPVILGGGRTMFDTVTSRLPLKLIRTRAFANGNILLCYEPAR